MDKKTESAQQQEVFSSCPHCGKELSPWERVLLSVDRALTCKHCWYRILLDAVRGEQKPSPDNLSKGKG